MKKVLIVEEDPQAMVLIRDLFESDDCMILDAPNAQTAARMAQQESPDMVLWHSLNDKK